MALYFYGAVSVADNGQVSWYLHTGTAAEGAGVASLNRHGDIGGVGPDDGSGVRETNVLVALECLGAAMLTLSRTVAWSYSLLPDAEIAGARLRNALD